VALISDSMALNQALGEAERPWTQGQCVTRFLRSLR